MISKTHFEITHLMAFDFYSFFVLNQEDTCEYKPELAAAFVKNVVNITAVSEHESLSSR